MPAKTYVPRARQPVVGDIRELTLDRADAQTQDSREQRAAQDRWHTHCVALRRCLLLIGIKADEVKYAVDTLRDEYEYERMELSIVALEHLVNNLRCAFQRGQLTRRTDKDHCHG